MGAGWSRLGAETISDDRVRVVHTVLNFELVFPRCRLAVHHGGSGTVVASVAAGIPTLVCSVFADNPFWGRRVQNLGVGDHLPFPQLGRETLAVKLRGLLQDSMAARSVSVGHALRANPGGTRHAADLVEREFVG